MGTTATLDKPKDARKPKTLEGSSARRGRDGGRVVALQANSDGRETGDPSRRRRSREDRRGLTIQAMVAAPRGGPNAPAAAKPEPEKPTSAAERKRRQAARRRGGRPGTILTSGLGAPGSAAVSRPVLLGN
ncbi:MAG TPA: hypothetical protein EYP07_06010 [Kiloniellaceae bacterium]|nr:hypothetical protein [Kiloniellaceae bacterium]